MKYFNYYIQLLMGNILVNLMIIALLRSFSKEHNNNFRFINKKEWD